MFTMADVRREWDMLVDRWADGWGTDEENEIWSKIDDALKKEHGYHLAFHGLPPSTPLGLKSQAFFAELQKELLKDW